MLSSTIFTQNSPSTLAPVLLSDAETYVNATVPDPDFNPIRTVSLPLLYDNTVLIYPSATSNAGFPGLFSGNAIPGIGTISGFLSPGAGITRIDNSIFSPLPFVFPGDSTGMNRTDNGTSCKYSGQVSLYPILNDNTPSTLYVKGSVSGLYEPRLLTDGKALLTGNVAVQSQQHQM